MRLSKSIPAGLLDAGSAALATFGTGVYAAAKLAPAELGVYALFFASFLVATIVPFTLSFLPGEVRLLGQPKEGQLAGYRLTLPTGVPVALVSSLLVLLAWIPARDAELSLLGPLALTAVIAAILSPIQDHVRRVMHLAGRSWLAAMTSVVQLAVAAVFITGGVLVDLDPAWVPFGALVAANIVSMTVGFALARGTAVPAEGDPYSLRSLAAPGRWLAGVAVIQLGAAFVAASIVDITAGSEALGFAEAARIAARPLLVFVGGVSAVLNPPSLLAGRERNRSEGMRLARISKFVVLVPGFVFLVWMGFDWPGNPMRWLVREAFTIEFLTALTIVNNILWGMLFSEDSQLVGGRRERDIFKIYVVAALVQIPIAFTAPVTKSFALVLSLLGFAVVRYVGFRWSIKQLYSPAPSPAANDR